MAVTPEAQPSPAFQVRPATEADVHQIVDIGRSVFSVEFAHTMTPEDLVKYLDEFYTAPQILSDLSDPSYTIFVASTAGPDPCVAGFAYLRYGAHEPCVESYPKRIELWRLYVDSRLQSAGVGKLLMQRCFNSAIDQGFRTMWLGVYEENWRAQKFYLKHGFEKVGEHGFWTGDTVTTDWIVVKSLV
ncbi:MAG: hypothetical protein Q9159_004994 [Coniocarpon cinnabarinum]